MAFRRLGLPLRGVEQERRTGVGLRLDGFASCKDKFLDLTGANLPSEKGYAASLYVVPDGIGPRGGSILCGQLFAA